MDTDMKVNGGMIRNMDKEQYLRMELDMKAIGKMG